ncbi:Golgi transport complex subunit 6 [Sorochytrium milnesiophthora]
MATVATADAVAQYRSTSDTGSSDNAPSVLAERVKRVLASPILASIGFTAGPGASSAESSLSALHRLSDLVALSDQSSGSASAIDLGKLQRNFASSIDEAMGGWNGRFLSSLSILNAEVDSLDGQLRELKHDFGKLDSIYQVNVSQTHALLDEVDAIQRKIQATGGAHATANAFIEKFVTTEADVQTLMSTNNKRVSLSPMSPVSAAPASADLSPRFFQALRDLRQKQENCQMLLAYENNPASVEAIELNTMHLDRAFDRLYRWLSHYIQQFSRITPVYPSQFPRALLALQDRPVLFQTVVDDLCQQRRTAVQRLFGDAVQRGVNGARAIELSAHDPLGYCGDLLAWMHQTVAAECELWSAIFEQHTDDDNQAAVLSPVIPLSDILNSIINRSMDATVRPFRARIEEAIVLPQATAIALLKLSHLIRFYSDTIQKTLHRLGRSRLQVDALVVCTMLGELRVIATKAFLERLDETLEDMLGGGETPQADLMPIRSCRRIASMLREVLDAHENSLAAAGSANTEEENAVIHGAIDRALHPSIQMALSAGRMLSPIDNLVFVCNCVSELLNAMSTSSFAALQYHAVEQRLSGFIEELVRLHTQHMIASSGLEPIVQELESPSAKGVPLSQVEGFDDSKMTAIFAQLGAYLATAHLALNASLQKMQDAASRGEVYQRAVANFVALYELVAKSVRDPLNGYMAAVHHLKSAYEVLSYLTFRSLLCAASVSRAWRQYVLHEPRLWRSIYVSDDARQQARKDSNVRAVGAIALKEGNVAASVRRSNQKLAGTTTTSGSPGDELQRATLRFLKRAHNAPKSLKIESSFLTDKTLQAITAQLFDGRNASQGKGLASLSLHRCHKLSNVPFHAKLNGVMMWPTLSPTLRQLSLQDVPGVDDVALLALLQHCPHITSLTLGRLSNLRGAAFALYYDWLRSKDAGGRVAQPLAHLTVAYCVLFLDTVIDLVAETFPTLQTVNLSHNAQLTSMSMLGLRSIQGTLTTLDCSGISAHAPHAPRMDVAVVSLCEAAPRLTHIAMNQCRDLSAEALVMLTMYAAPTLQSVSVHSCPLLTSAALSCLAECTQLRRLDVHGTPGVDDAAIARIAERCPLLEWLDISRTPGNQVTDTALKRIGDRLHRLEYLSAAHCPGITGAGVESVILGAFKLWTLDISGCERVSTAALQRARTLIRARGGNKGEVRYQYVYGDKGRRNIFLC